MPRAVILVLLIEFALISFTSLLLAQPKPFFSFKSEKIRKFAFGTGIFLLCLTFCWSVVVGILLSMNDLTIGI